MRLRQEPIEKYSNDMEPINEKNPALEQAFADLEEEIRRETVAKQLAELEEKK